MDGWINEGICIFFLCNTMNSGYKYVHVSRVVSYRHCYMSQITSILNTNHSWWCLSWSSHSHWLHSSSCCLFVRLTSCIASLLASDWQFPFTQALQQQRLLLTEENRTSMWFIAFKIVAKGPAKRFLCGLEFSSFLKSALVNLFVIHFASWEVKLKPGQRYTLRGEHSSCQRESPATNNPQVDSSSCFVIVLQQQRLEQGGGACGCRLIQDKDCCWNNINLADVSAGCCAVGFKGEGHCQKYFSWKAKSLTLAVGT